MQSINLRERYPSLQEIITVRDQLSAASSSASESWVCSHQRLTDQVLKKTRFNANVRHSPGEVCSDSTYKEGKWKRHDVGGDRLLSYSV